MKRDSGVLLQYQRTFVESFYKRTQPDGLCGWRCQYQVSRRHPLKFNAKRDLIEDVNLCDPVQRVDFTHWMTHLAQLTGQEDIISTTARAVQWIHSSLGYGEDKWSGTLMPSDLWFRDYWLEFMSYDGAGNHYTGSMFVAVDKEYALLQSTTVPTEQDTVNQQLCQFHYVELKNICRQPNFFVYQGAHFFLQPSPNSATATKELREAVTSLARILLDTVSVDLDDVLVNELTPSTTPHHIQPSRRLRCHYHSQCYQQY
jgi:hypothetical protein